MPKSPLHRRITQLLFERVWEHARSAGGDWLVQKEDPLTFADSEPEPDLSVVRGRMRDFDQAHPARAEWVVEVAVSSLEVDRMKAGIYAEAGVAEYWIVEPDREVVEVFRRPENGRYAEHLVLGNEAPIAPMLFPDLEVRLADFLPAS